MAKLDIEFVIYMHDFISPDEFESVLDGIVGNTNRKVICINRHCQ